MKGLFHKIYTDHKWFIGFLIVVVFLILFFWRLVDRTGFTDTINGFLKDINTIFWYLVTIIIAFVGLAIVLGWRPFTKKKSGH